MIKNDDDKKEENKESNDNNNNSKKEEINLSSTNLNITFIYNGQKTNLVCGEEMTVEQLINMYKEKSDNIINENYVFLYNAQLLDIKDKRKIKAVFSDNSIIHVNKK